MQAVGSLSDLDLISTRLEAIHGMDEDFISSCMDKVSVEKRQNLIRETRIVECSHLKDNYSWLITSYLVINYTQGLIFLKGAKVEVAHRHIFVSFKLTA